MLRNKEQRVLLILGSLAVAPLAHSAETIFFEDFGCTGAAGTKAGGGVCTGGATAPKTWTSIANPDGEGGGTYRAGPAGGVNQIIRADSSTATVTQDAAPVNFSVTGRNWDIHDGSQITQISGYRTPNTASNANMSGNMLGHVVSSDVLPSNNEDNYYQINGIQLNSKLSNIQLSFDFDSYIFADGDGFGVAVSIDGVNFDILNPTAASAMQYRNLPTTSADYSLDVLLGEATGSTQRGYDGSGNNIAGTALFDLSGFANKTISLRFAYASVTSDTGGSREGINIDNILVTGVCTTGSGPNCNTPNNNAPEPASLGLALLGLTAVSWRRRAKRA